MRKEKRKRQGKRLIVVRIGSKEEKDDLFSRAEGKLFLRESERQTGKTFPRDRPTTQRFCSCCGDNGLTSHPLLSLLRKERRQKKSILYKNATFFAAKRFLFAGRGGEVDHFSTNVLSRESRRIKGRKRKRFFSVKSLEETGRFFSRENCSCCFFHNFYP